MTDTKHTPGPWVVCGDGFHVKPVPMHQFLRPLADIAPIITWDGKAKKWAASDFEQAKANARLIAAAPEMYEALKDSTDVLEYMLQSFQDLGWDDSAEIARLRIKMNRAIIAKAEGKT